MPRINALTGAALVEVFGRVLRGLGIPNLEPFAAPGIKLAFRAPMERRSSDGMFRTPENWLCLFTGDKPLDPAGCKQLIDATIAANVEHLLVLSFGQISDEAGEMLRQSLARENVRVTFLDSDLAQILVSDFADSERASNTANQFSFSRLRSSIQTRVEQEPWLKRFQTTSIQPMRVLPLSAKEAALAEADLFRALSGGSLLILGEPGAGKTTAMLALARELAASGPYTPVFLPLGRYQGDFWSLLCESLSPGETPAPKKLAQALVSSGVLVLLLDGLNEVQDPDLQAQLVREVNGLTDPAEPTTHSRWVISGRVHDYQQSHLILSHLDARRWEMQRLTADLIFRFLASSLGDAEARVLYESLGEAVHELCANPLLLNMVVAIYREKRSAPTSRSALYRQFVALLMGWGDERGLGASARAALGRLSTTTLTEASYKIMAEEALTALAAGMSTTMIQWAAARQLISEGLGPNQDANQAAALLIEDLTGRGLLVRDVFNRVRFFHHTFQEYFQARTLFGKSPEDLIPSSGVPAARYESVVFFAGLLDDPTPLIRRAVAVDLRLASALLFDTSKHVPAEIIHLVAAALWRRTQQGGTTGTHRRYALLFKRVAALAGETIEAMAAKADDRSGDGERKNTLHRFYGELGDLESQRRLLSQAITGDQVPKEFLFEAAKTAGDSGDNVRAVDLYTKLVREKTEDPWVFNNRAVHLGLLGRKKEAIDDYLMAIKLNDQAPFRAALAWQLYDLGRKEEALQELRKALDLDPTYAYSHQTMADWIKSDCPETALAHLEQAARFAPHDEDLRAFLPRLVALQEKLHQYAPAIRSLKSMIALDPTSLQVTGWKEKIASLRQTLDAEERTRSTRERLQERGELPLPTLAIEWLRASGITIKRSTAAWLLVEGGRGLPLGLSVVLMPEPVVTALALRAVIDSMPPQARTVSHIVMVSAAEILSPEARHQLAALQDQYKVALVTALEIRDALLQSDRECRLLLERALQRSGQSDNPFDYKGVVREQTEFFGRVAEIDELAVKIGRGQQVGLYGIHKIGKSSLLEQIRRKLHLSNPEMTVVSIELNDSLKDAADLYKAILDKLPGSTDNSNVRFVSAAVFRNELAAYHKQRDRDRPGHRILLLLDEYAYLIPDRRGHYGLKGFLEALGLFKALHQEGWFILVACGRTADLNRQASWGDAENPFIDMLHPRFLGPLPAEESDAMMNTLGLRGKVTFSPEALAGIYEESGGHPAFSRALGSEIVRDGHGAITVERVRRAVDRFLGDRDQRAVLTAIYEKRLDEDEQKLARTLALQGPQPRKALFPASASPAERRLIRDALANLLDTFVLIEKGDGIVAHRYGLLRRVIQMEAKELGYED